MENQTNVKEFTGNPYYLKVSNNFIEIDIIQSEIDQTFAAHLSLIDFNKIGYTLDQTKLISVLKNAHAGFPFEGHLNGILETDENTYIIYLPSLNIRASKEEVNQFKEAINIVTEKISKKMLFNN